MLLELLSNKLGFGRSQEIQYIWLDSALVEAETGQDTLVACLTHKLANALLLFINLRKWVGLLLNSGLLNQFIQVKIMEYASHWTLHLKTFYLSDPKMLL